jgi:fatty-acyl-CoA synthase
MGAEGTASKSGFGSAEQCCAATFSPRNQNSIITARWVVAFGSRLSDVSTNSGCRKKAGRVGGFMETALTPLEFARRARRLYADREAVVDNDLRFTYREFFERCDRWSAALQKLGVRPGDRVAYIAPNVHAQLESFYAVLQIGATLVPINYRLTADDFAYLIQHSGARVVCAHSDYQAAVDRIRSQAPDVEHFVALDGAREGWLDYESTLRASPAGFTRPVIHESDLATINYTSGTTSRPKGVMITHRNAYMNVVGTLIHFHMTPADRYLWTLPMFHANGWTFVWTITAVGGTHVCLSKVEARTAFESINRERITAMCAAPTVLIFLANAPEEMRRNNRAGIRVITAGAPPAAATIERIESEFGWTLTHVYGLTETSPFISICEPRPEHAALPLREGCVIKARQGVELVTSGELRVVDAQGCEVPHDGETLGEITASGNAIMKGYYKDPEATARVIRDGWFYTGDAAVVHPDGYIEVRDRLKDVIISGGENISSVEVEGILLRHPAVQEVAVVGFPDEKWGEAPRAFLVLKAGTSATEDELRAFARERMAHFKVPHYFVFVPELPKTATGKIQKYILRGKSAAIHRQ